MAISTPRQKPRGSAKSTRSTSTTAGYRRMPPIAWRPMSVPVVVSVAPGSAAERAGLCAGDEVLTINGIVPGEVVEWRRAAEEAEVDVGPRRGGGESYMEIAKRAGEPLGAEVSSALF